MAILFVSVATVELALARLAARVAAGGHDVPEETVRRRFPAGLRYFFSVYRHRVDRWRVLDNSGDEPVLLAQGRPNLAKVYGPDQWADLVLGLGPPFPPIDRNTRPVTKRASITDLVVSAPSTTAQTELERVRVAVKEALVEHRRLGHSVVVLRDGNVVWLRPGQY